MNKEEEIYYEHNDQYFLQVSINKVPEIVIYDLGQYYEPFKRGIDSEGVCPLISGQIIKHGKRTYRVDRIFCKEKGKNIKQNGYDFDGHCYIFIDSTIGLTNKKPFAKKPSEVNAMINKFIITNWPGWN